MRGIEAVASESFDRFDEGAVMKDHVEGEYVVGLVSAEIMSHRVVDGEGWVMVISADLGGSEDDVAAVGDVEP